MALPWVRLEGNIGTHDKILDLLSRKDGHRAFVLYICALGWCGGQGTDGVVPAWALGVNHGDRKLGDMLVDCRLWTHEEAGAYRFPTWDRRQEPAIVREVRKTMREMSSRKANCVRWHGKDCGCWQNETTSE